MTINPFSPILDTAVSNVIQILNDFASDPLFAEKLTAVFGLTVSAQTFRDAVAALPEIEVLADSELKGASGAFSAQTGKIYLAEGLLQGEAARLEVVLIEEIGHFVDAQGNSTDTVGDEGELFSAIVRGVSLSTAELSRIKTEDDHAVMMIEGKKVAIEMANATAIQLNGTNQQADLGTWFNYQSFTVEMWVKAGVTQVKYADIIDNNHTDSRSWVVQQNENATNSYVFGVNGSSNAGVSFVLNPSTWQHLTFVKDVNSISVYIDGVIVGSTAYNGSINYDGSQFLRIGNWGGGGRNWNGNVDEVRIWSTALAASEIASNYNLYISPNSTDLVAYYSFDEGTGSTSADLTLKGHTANLINNPVWTNDVPVLLNPQPGVTINGTSNDDNLIGTVNNDTILGLAGNDKLDGKAGSDNLQGGTGNDTYTIDSTGDIVTENVNEGTDTVRSYITYTLGNNLENLTLLGGSTLGGTGNELNNTLLGNNGNNNLSGGAGNDILDGQAGNDTMQGGLGNDTYTLSSAGDVVTENANEGTDTVKTYLTYTLGNNLENLTLLGNADIDGTGNSLNNSLTGNNFNNTLSGGDGNDTLNGTIGNDTLIGGNGNDFAYYYNATDSVIVNLATGIANDGQDGIDTLSQIENVQGSNTAGDNLTGNTGVNVLYGYGGADILNGGDGNDTLIGGTGNDLLTGGNGNDFAYYYTVTGAVTVNLATGTASDGEGGTDTLSQIENVQGSNTAGDNLTGNTGVNVLYGYGGADILTGGGGNDLLYVGSDTVKDTVNYTSGDGADTVYNFVRGASGDLLKFTGITAIDVQVSGTSTLFKVGDGISGNTGFGTGTLLLTTSATSGFVAADVNVNLLGATFAFS
jgi:Ca2+-binding RTX toxin-like protein